jgi:ABC-type branched-subunit amino acid transport system permease subunit
VKRLGPAVIAVVAIVLAVAPLALSSYQLGLLTKMVILAVFAMSLNLVLGYAGLPSLGHAAYFGIAGYTVALLALRGHANLWLGAGAALVWAPAADRRLIGDAYGPGSDFLFRSLSQWDARWFLQISIHGYEEVPQAAAFFPVYPAAVHALAWVTGSPLVAGVLISLAAAAVAAWALAEIARPLLGERGARDAVLYLALYPIGFVLTSLYSEGLFLALATGAFLAAMRGWPVAAGVLGGLATGTRLIGLALLPALALLLWRGRGPRALLPLAPLLLLPAAVGLYALYLNWAIGDPWAFTSAQADWNREGTWLGPIDGLADAVLSAGRGARDLLDVPAGGPGPDQRAGLWNVSHLALLAAAGWLTWVAWRRLGPAFGAYSLATLAIALSAPAEGFPLVSLPRFVLADFPLFLALASLTLDRPRARDALLVAFAALGAAAAAAFARGIWIA